jgi:hypothetical protein
MGDMYLQDVRGMMHPCLTELRERVESRMKTTGAPSSKPQSVEPHS